MTRAIPAALVLAVLALTGCDNNKVAMPTGTITEWKDKAALSKGPSQPPPPPVPGKK